MRQVHNSELRLRGFLGKDAGLLDNVIAFHRNAVLNEVERRLVDKMEADAAIPPASAYFMEAVEIFRRVREDMEGK